MNLRVAVKTLHRNVPIKYFKALLSELKILAFIGAHDNVANLVGACTANIKSLELYIAVEYCKTSLLQHLRVLGSDSDRRRTTEEWLDAKGSHVQLVEQIHETSFQENVAIGYDLARWVAEIATGMKFLSSRRVDLAARNVLSFEGLHAKICDFGLARQLVDYSCIKSQRCNLP